MDYLVKAGHKVVIETNDPLGSGFTDQDYKAVDAKIVDATKEVWIAEMVMKVKEPLKE